jgi:hypothetical protein
MRKQIELQTLYGTMPQIKTVAAIGAGVAVGLVAFFLIRKYRKNRR